ncbi:MAG: tRNA uridine-5-carboxymethylaminomethyl(34) synthesis GTPase MnmE [Gammaproteobacteria bacterium]|nr:tRNA uridine-5-carboxymethylaminomethyl(34) synthesis GTPase MnmE [Gammaproteobacteria bacterium]
MSLVDTIVALATPPGFGGVGVIRVSGPLTRTITKNILNKTLEPRHATFCRVYSESRQIIDEGVAIYFEAPHSFTGEDVLEVQGHGSPVVLNLIIEEILKSGARTARPGEFSERAFLNGKIDLTQAEAIMDFIHAQSKRAAKASLFSMQGVFAKEIEKIKDYVVSIRVDLESQIDFAEEDIVILDKNKLEKKIDYLIEITNNLILKTEQGRILRDGLSVVIAGKPNVGKSSLLNYLSGYESAIVTDIPGTTRDILTEFINLDGLPLHIIDTAGIRETDDLVEMEGVKRAKKAMDDADFILFMTDNDSDYLNLPKHFLDKTIIIRNKIDLNNTVPKMEDNKVFVSVKNKLGLDLLKNILKKRSLFDFSNESVFSVRTRHVRILDNILMILKKIKSDLSLDIELIADDMRVIQNNLGEITGEFYPDDLLDVIFSEFCIGK